MNVISRKEAAALDAPVVNFTLDGREVSGRADETLIEIADREGVEIQPIKGRAHGVTAPHFGLE